MRLPALTLIALLVAGAAYAQTAGYESLCRTVDELNIYNPDQPEVRFTTPPYLALKASGTLMQIARRPRPLAKELSLNLDQTACLDELTGSRLTAVRAGSTYRYKLQSPQGTFLIFHVADLVGSESIIPTQVERLLANADRFLGDGNRPEAARAYREALNANPRPVEAALAYTALGRLAKQEGRVAESFQHFGQALKADPSYIPALEERALLAESMGLKEEERKAYEALIDLLPGRPGPYVALIKLALERDDRDEMQRLFRGLQSVDEIAAVRLIHDIPSLKDLKTERALSPLVKDVIEIPLKSRPDGSLLAEVSVKGSEPMTFIVDTGSSLVTLKESTARSIGIEIDPTRVALIKTAKGARTSPVINIDRMEIQGIEARDVRGSILDEDLGSGIEGLLGQSFLNKIKARIDVVKKTMVVE